MKESIKDQLRGTCVKNESKEMGAEIVALYQEVGFKIPTFISGCAIGCYYGDSHGEILALSKHDFKSVLTIDQLRDIVRGKQPVRIDYSHGCTPEQKKEIESAIMKHRLNNQDESINSHSLNNWTEIKSIMLEQAFKKLGLKPADIFSNPGSLNTFFSNEPTEELRRAWYKIRGTYLNNKSV